VRKYVTGPGRPKRDWVFTVKARRLQEARDHPWWAERKMVEALDACRTWDEIDRTSREYDRALIVVEILERLDKG
jgi:hypothetical protein